MVVAIIVVIVVVVFIVTTATTIASIIIATTTTIRCRRCCRRRRCRRDGSMRQAVDAIRHLCANAPQHAAHVTAAAATTTPAPAPMFLAHVVVECLRVLLCRIDHVPAPLALEPQAQRRRWHQRGR